MTTPERIKANRRNALASTGPRTTEGQAISSRNATRHGILSHLEVLPGLESTEDWNAHLDAILLDLAPEGHLETTLAERVALQLWRLGRLFRTVTGSVRRVVPT
jgi:hypothetical protein